jgi:hypothetical protein
MKKFLKTDALRDLAARLQDHDVEVSMLRKVLDIQLKRIGELQAELELLQSREDPDVPAPVQRPAEPSAGEPQSEPFSGPVRFIGRQEILASAARGCMWQP